MAAELYYHHKLSSPFRLQHAANLLHNTVREALKDWGEVTVDAHRLMVRMGLDYVEAKAVVNEVALRLEEDGFIVKWLQSGERFKAFSLEEGGGEDGRG